MSSHRPLVYRTLALASFLVAGAIVARPVRAAFPSPPALEPQASLLQAYVQPGYSLQLMASEPLVADPVAIDWGPDGRLWVVEMADYPYGMDDQGTPGGRIRFLEDTDDDGLYDRSVVFLDGVSFPTAVMPWRDGVLVTAAPELFYATDTDGDGRADHREVLFRGFIEGNQQLRVNGLRYGLDHWVYCAAGGHHAGFGADNSITIQATGERVALGSRDFRFQPDTRAIDPQSGPSQFGRVRDDWGHWFGVQNSYPLWNYVLEDDVLRRNPRGRYGDVRQQLRLPINPAVFPASAQQKRYHSFEHSGHYTSACGPCVYRDDALFAAGEITHAFTCEPFHNLVQHHELLDDGVTFRGQRAATSTPYDFYASADRWSRPVMARTGPDGALWIVDMYRFMIEHPDWLPPEGREELKPFYRSGADRGRIYRVCRTTDALPRVPRLDTLTDKQLVEQLASDNGPLRDLVQRRLIEHEAADQQVLLVELLTTHDNPRVRLQALATLDGLSCLSDSQLLQSLRDSHPLVRRHALRLAGRRAEASNELLEAILALRHDPSAKVHLQLIITLGDIPSAEAASTLREFAPSAASDRFLTGAFVSSLPMHLEAIVDGLSPARPLPAAILSATCELAADRPTLAAQLLLKLVPENLSDADVSAFEDCTIWLIAMREQGLNPLDMSVPNAGELAGGIQRLHTVLEFAWQVAGDSTRPAAMRVAALELVSLDLPATRLAHREHLVTLLSPQSPSTVQHLAARILVAEHEPSSVQAVLDAWSSFLSATRAEVINRLMGDVASTHAVLQRMADGQIGRLDLDAVQRDQLLHHPNAAIAAQARAVFDVDPATDRATVLSRYQIATQLTGDVSRGGELFQKHCATCHAPTEGARLGPNLSSLTDRTAKSLLLAMLDPSRSVEPKYLAYHAELKSGEVLYGLIVGESGNTLRLRPLTGPTRELLRDSIEHLDSSRRSFMPDGLELELSPQDVADVIQYVQRLD